MAIHAHLTCVDRYSHISEFQYDQSNYASKLAIILADETKGFPLGHSIRFSVCQILLCFSSWQVQEDIQLFYCYNYTSALHLKVS